MGFAIKVELELEPSLELGAVFKEGEGEFTLRENNPVEDGFLEDAGEVKLGLKGAFWAIFNGFTGDPSNSSSSSALIIPGFSKIGVDLGLNVGVEGS